MNPAIHERIIDAIQGRDGVNIYEGFCLTCVWLYGILCKPWLCSSAVASDNGFCFFLPRRRNQAKGKVQEIHLAGASLLNRIY